VQAIPPWWEAGSAAGRAAGAPSTAAALLASQPCTRPAHGTSLGRPACSGTALWPPAPLPYNTVVFQVTPEEGGGGRLVCLEVFTSVTDPDPEDPYVFGPPRSASESVGHKYGSGCVSFLFSNKSVERTEIMLAK
jgi:hypothetical protein